MIVEVSSIQIYASFKQPFFVPAWNCSEISLPAYGNVECTDGLLYNSSCNFTCDTGYDASGTTWRSCQDSRQWSGADNFTCTGKIKSRFFIFLKCFIVRVVTVRSNRRVFFKRFAMMTLM